MNLKDSCKIRIVRKVNKNTPLLIPSFSSVFSNDIGNIKDYLIDYINEISLVSGYDLYYKKINIDNLWHSDIVFIDSGMYEVRSLENTKYLKDWNMDLYKSVLDELIPKNKFVIVNNDLYSSINQQIEEAIEMFTLYGDYAHCYLYKPLNQGDKINISDLLNNVEIIENKFDILAITEKELGFSLEERCKNIVKIRKELSRRREMPIHIFGCLDPLSIISYFICGADIFDGLNWLKYTFYKNIAVYINNHALLNNKWSESDSRSFAHSCVLNLTELNNLRARMEAFSRTNDYGIFQLSDNVLAQIKSLISIAGVDY